MMARERTRRTVFPLTGRPSYAYMAAWEDEVSTKKVMNLKLGVTPKDDTNGGGHGQRTEC